MGSIRWGSWRRGGGPPIGSNIGSLLYVGGALMVVMAVIAIATRPLLLVVQVVVVAAGLFGPRWRARRRFVNEIFQRTRQITRDEEYEADVAQDRSRLRAILTGDLRALLFRTYWENVRKSVRPGRYVQVRFSRSVDGIFDRPLRMWWPQKQDIVVVARRWPPIFEPFAGPPGQSGLERLHRQVAAFFDVGTAGDLAEHEWPMLEGEAEDEDGDRPGPPDRYRALSILELNRKVRRVRLSLGERVAEFVPVLYDAYEAYEDEQIQEPYDEGR